MSLTVGKCSGDDHHFSARAYRYRGSLRTVRVKPTNFDVTNQADSNQSAILSRLTLHLSPFFVSRKIESFLKSHGIISAIVIKTGPDVVRVRIFRYEIDHPDL